MDIIAYISNHNLSQYVYLALFFGMFLDANLTILSTAFLFLQSNGLFSYFIFAPVVLGGFAEQFALVYVGEHLGKKDKVLNWANKIVGKYDRHLTANMFHSLLLSKFILGLHRAVLVRIGMLKPGWKKFIFATLKSTFIWLLIVGILGFLFSASYKVLAQYFRYAGLLFLFFVLVFIFLEFAVSRKLKKDL